MPARRPESIGKRISELKLETGKSLEAGKRYKVAGWASVNPQARQAGLGRARRTICVREESRQPYGSNVTLKGVDGNPGIAG